MSYSENTNLENLGESKQKIRQRQEQNKNWTCENKEIKEGFC